MKSLMVVMKNDGLVTNSGFTEMKGCMRYSALVRWDGERQNRRSLLVFLSLVFQGCEMSTGICAHRSSFSNQIRPVLEKAAPCPSSPPVLQLDSPMYIHIYIITFHNAIIPPTTNLTFASILTTPIQTDDSSLELYRLNISPLNSSPV